MKNLTKTDHTSTPLGFFASKYDVGIAMPTYFNFASKTVPHKTNIGGVGTPPYVAKSVLTSKNLAAWLPSRLAAKRVAFTLAEVLITLGIIGVVAALTLPSVISNYQTKQRITQLKKVYNTLSQAYEMGVAENGGNRDIRTWANVILYYSKTDYIATLMQYTKPIHVCNPEDDDCVNKDYVAKNLGFDTFGLVYILEDGVIIGRGNENTPDYGIIKVDINGTKSPNKNGEDIFLFSTGYYYAERRSMDGISLDPTYYSPSDGNYHCIRGDLAHCAKWALTYNNMDYLKCRDKLQADGSVHSCKDAK